MKYKEFAETREKMPVQLLIAWMNAQSDNMTSIPETKRINNEKKSFILLYQQPRIVSRIWKGLWKDFEDLHPALLEQKKKVLSMAQEPGK